MRDRRMTSGTRSLQVLVFYTPITVQFYRPSPVLYHEVLPLPVDDTRTLLVVDYSAVLGTTTQFCNSKIRL
jgi:hypothetical protein